MGGLAIIVGAVLLKWLVPLLRSQPDGSAGRVLVLEFGARPTGVDGRWTRGDRLRAAWQSFIALLCCVGVAWFGFATGARSLNGSPWNLAFGGIGFVGTIGAIMAFGATVASLVAAPFARGVPTGSASLRPRGVLDDST